MINLRSLGQAIVLVCIALGLTLSAQAQTQTLPTSINPATGEWKVMHPNSQPKTIAAARLQCDKDADLESNDRLNLKHCAVFEAKLTNGQCDEVMVRDGTNMDMVNGRNSIARNVTKQTGRDDPALLCYLGDDVYAYWFMMSSEESCNNVGIVFGEIKPILPEVKPKEPEAVEYEWVQVCEPEPFTSAGQPEYPMFLSGYVLLDCGHYHYMPGITLFPPSGTSLHGSGHTMRCTFVKRVKVKGE